VATIQKPPGKGSLHATKDRTQGRTGGATIQEQPQSATIQAVVMLAVVGGVLLSTAWLLIDMLLQVAF